jgi:hypothetical protein
MATLLYVDGLTVSFDGFLALYREDRDEPLEDDEEGRTLPPVAAGDRLRRGTTTSEQHFTQPPPRYTEASLVKRLEELGIGRPSTYASIMQVLQGRDYVRLDKRRFVPEDRGRIVTVFLESFFRRYVEYDFTAKLEDLLDEISGGRADWKAVLRDFCGLKAGDRVTIHMPMILELPITMLACARATDEMIEGMVNYGRMLVGVEIAALVWETASSGGTECKASLRGAAGADVSKIAVALGGGGYRSAAGATLKMPLATAQLLVLKEAEKLLL